MINKDRIVPITAVDLLSMYGLILLQNEEGLVAVSSDTVEGDFNIEEASTALLADEPVKTVNFGESVTTATLYFVAAYDYKGFTINGEAAEVEAPEEEGVLDDGRTLYKAELASGTVTITKVGF